MILRRLTVGVVAVIAFSSTLYSQSSGEQMIYTTIPFVTIAPDSRGGAMGDLGVSTTPDVNSQHWNPAKYAFINGKTGVAIAFTPWLRSLVNDINLGYLVAYYRIDDRQVVSGSLKYFSLGEIEFIDINQTSMGNFTPNEFDLDAAYSRKFSDYFSGALAFRFIRSDLTGGGSFEGQQTNAGYSFAADLATYYQHPLDIGGKSGEIAWGINISNLGTKISYTEGSDKYFIPANMRIGARYLYNLDEYNSLTLSFDLNKLLVPTPPIYYADSVDANGNKVIEKGYKTPTSIPLSWIQSFYDAPGGFKEEMKEVMYSVGLEYWYRQQFALRSGYFHESPQKGNRKYFAVGVGMKLNVFFLDFSYLVSTSGRSNPLANTMRFTLGLNFGESTKKR